MSGPPLHQILAQTAPAEKTVWQIHGKQPDCGPAVRLDRFTLERIYDRCSAARGISCCGGPRLGPCAVCPDEYLDPAAPNRHLKGVARQAPKFAIVGAAATLVHFLTLFLLVTVVRFPYPTIASAIGSIFGISTSYVGNYSWTFTRNEPHREFIARFIAVYGFTMAINNGIFFLQIHLLHLHYAVAFVIATGLSTLMNFVLTKLAVFERPAIKAACELRRGT